MRRQWVRLLAGGAILLGAASCAVIPAEPGPPAPAAPAWTAVPLSEPESVITVEKPAMNPTSTPAPIEPGLEEPVAQAKADLAARTGLSLDEIELIEVQSVVWPDGSLGCPQPDMGYTQVQVDGLLIRLGAGGQTYEYHSGGTRAPFLCEAPG
jgi:hypothetical protein